MQIESASITPTTAPAKQLVCVDPASRQLLQLIERLAPSGAPILINGETGTGKELIARHIHRLSGRSGPFLAVNCSAISETLAESELFGHEAGAFTGASGRREGWFEAANQGTLFLDEIGDLPLALQGKLLRVLQEHEVVRLGSRKSVAVDVRLITATNVDLGEAVSAGHFRLDLFYRLNIAQVVLPALRERPGDIIALADHFLRLYSARLNLPLPVLGAEAMHALKQYSWPGNIRELENVIHFALLVASGQEIRPEHLKLNGNIAHAPKLSPPAPPSRDDTPLQRLSEALRLVFESPGTNVYAEVERRVIEEAYRSCGFNQVRTANMLGISRNILRSLLKKHRFIGGDTPRDADSSASADQDSNAESAR
jgi:DNA-binding NtrC family response regulator